MCVFILIPGMISRVLFPDQLACIGPDHCMQVCGSAAGCSNVAYPRLVMAVMPVGLRGLMMAAMIAALMSDLDSIFNSASTIFTLDIYKMLRKDASPKELVITGRLFVVLMVALSIAWVPVVIEMQGGQMFYYIQEVSDYLTPPVAALFLLGVLWRRCNETGAFWGGVVGSALGALRLLLAVVYREPYCGQPDERPSFIKEIHFMYVAAVLFWVSAITTIIVSLCTSPPEEQLIRTTTLWGLRQRMKFNTLAIGQGEGNLNKTNTTGNGGGVVGEETLHSHQNKLMCTDGRDENTQSSNGNIIPARSSLQNDIAEPMLEGDGDGREVKDVEEGKESRLGEGGDSVKVCGSICGQWKKSPQPRVVTAQEQERIVNKLLYEPPKTRIILNTALVLICVIGIFLYLYFSL